MLIPTIMLGGSEYNIGDPIDHAMSFAENQSTYLERVQSASATSTRKFTISVWSKIALADGETHILYKTEKPSVSSTKGLLMLFGVTSRTLDLTVAPLNSTATYYEWLTNATFYDDTGWRHFVWAVDTEQPVATDRMKLWVNGNLFTDWQQQQTIPQNLDLSLGDTNYFHRPGYSSGSSHWNGAMADFIFVDGQYLDETDFGEFNGAGVWVPRNYSGTYGNDGFRLEFADSGALGTDSAGNGSFTVNNATVPRFHIEDTPTNNHARLIEGITESGSITYLDGGFTATIAGNRNKIAMNLWMEPGSGVKYYCEGKVTASAGNPAIGVTAQEDYTKNNKYFGQSGLEKSWVIFTDSGTYYNNGSQGASGTGAFAVNDIVNLAYDPDTGSLWFGKNGTWVGDPAAGTGATVTGITDAVSFCHGYQGTIQWGTEDDIWQYSAPSGFVSLNTQNLPEPEIADPSEYFDIITYSGDGSNPRDITGLNFQPDFVAIKSLTSARSYYCFDSARGVDKGIFFDLDSAELNPPQNGKVSAFLPNGFTVDNGGTNDTGVNNSGDDFVAYCLKDDPLAGFDIVTYTGNGAQRTIAHDLGVVPEMIWLKNRSQSVTDWLVYHKALGTGLFVETNTNLAAATTVQKWGGTDPTSSVFSTGAGTANNGDGDDMIAYLFASVPGFSKVGYYSGSGMDKGAFVWCGFRPAFVLIKRTNSTGSWHLYDAKRSPFNPADNYLKLNFDDAAATNSILAIDMQATGFVLRNNNNSINASGDEYIFYAIAEQPANYSRAR